MQAETPDDRTDSAPISVLVCENSQVQRRILCGILERSGFVVGAVATDVEALRCMQTAPPDIFITGIEVGRQSGLELCWHVKSHDDTEHVYTLVVTASADPQRVVESLDCGADDFVRKPFDEAELRARLRAAARIVRMQRSLKALAETDPLTGAANRRYFMRCLEAETARASRYSLPLSVMMLDLDHFKQVNDRHGHAVGDEVLISSVRVMQANLRKQDIVGRLGGEEFAILLPHTDATTAVRVAERIRSRIATMEIGTAADGKLRVSASFGVCPLSAPNETADSLLQTADAALYAAKSGGRNRVQLLSAVTI